MEKVYTLSMQEVFVANTGFIPIYGGKFILTYVNLFLRIARIQIQTVPTALDHLQGKVQNNSRTSNMEPVPRKM